MAGGLVRASQVPRTHDVGVISAPDGQGGLEKLGLG
jgi:hypothetical protein